jgi:hypothetical protein
MFASTLECPADGSVGAIRTGLAVPAFCANLEMHCAIADAGRPHRACGPSRNTSDALSPAPTIRDSIDISADSIFFRVRRVTSLNIWRQRRRPGQPCREEFREIGVVGLCALFRASRRGRARNHSGRSGPCRAPAATRGCCGHSPARRGVRRHRGRNGWSPA